MATFVIAIISLLGAAFLVRFLIALCADSPKHSCEIIRVVRSPYDSVRLFPSGQNGRTCQTDHSHVVGEFYQLSTRHFRVK